MEPLLLQRKAELLLNKELYPLLKNFPKSEKFALCQEMKQSCYHFLRDIMTANNVKAERLYYLRKADTELKLLLVLVGVAREQRYINERRCLRLQTRIVELGRILGGWVNQTKAAQRI